MFSDDAGERGMYGDIINKNSMRLCFGLIPWSILILNSRIIQLQNVLIRWVWRGSLWVFKPTSFWGCPHFDPELRNMYQCTTRPLDFHQAACYWILPLKFWPAKVPNSKPAQRKSCTLSLSNRWNDFSATPSILAMIGQNVQKKLGTKFIQFHI